MLDADRVVCPMARSGSVIPLPRLLRAIAIGLAIATAAPAQDWIFLDGPTFPGRMSAYDWSREHLVALGADGATWEFANGEILARQVLGGSPPPRARGAMVYDHLHDRVILFGGQDGSGATLDDTWSWDGARWTQETSSVHPPGRVDAAIGYDILRGRVVLYGGQQPSIGQLTDTWEHDGTQWIQQNPTTLPGPNSPLMCYDIVRQVMVMVTHPGMLNAPVTTWEWNGVDWTLRASVGPTANGNESLAFDFARFRTVLFGGVGNEGQIWDWDGTIWQQTLVPTAPSRLNPAAYFNPSLGTLEVFGGFDFVTSWSGVAQGSGRLDAYAWDGSTWRQLHGDLRPASRYSHILCADPTGDVVMFGGVVQQAPADDTWTWDGNAWTQRSPAHRPPARSRAGAILDSARGETLLFGGNANGTAPADLWGWNGVDWHLRDSGTGPTGRTEPALAFDSARNAAVLFGGFGPPPHTSTPLRDTWEWNGTTWTPHSTATAPSPRAGAAMAYDLFRQRVVLFGGRTGFTARDQLNDTWEWDGSAWRSIVTSASPPALLSPSLQFVPASGTVLLVGTSLATSPSETQVWRYGGNQWIQVSATANDQLGGQIAWEPRRDRIVCFEQYVLAEWTSTPAQIAVSGPGCGTQIPMLMTRTRPRFGSPGSGLETKGPALQPVVFALATAPGSLSLGGGCTLHLGGALFTAVTRTSAAGTASIPLPIPPLTSFRGLVLHAQAAVLVPSEPLGFRLSQGIALTIGD